MPLRQADAFILRTYPLKESDKIVSFFTREWGKCRGVARGARRPRSKFGSTLEPLTEVRMQFFDREGRDLVSVDRCELLNSLFGETWRRPEPNDRPLSASGAGCQATSGSGSEKNGEPLSPLAGGGFDLLHSVSVSVMVEVADRMLPEREASDPVYRLLAVVTGALRRGAEPWLPLTYYLEWMVRLGGFLPSLAGGEQSPSSALGTAILQQGLPELLGSSLALSAAGVAGTELRKKLKFWIEDHVEAGLRSWPMLASLETGNDSTHP